MLSHKSQLEQRRVILVSPLPSVNIAKKKDLVSDNAYVQQQQQPHKNIQQGFRSSQSSADTSQNSNMNNMQSNSRRR